MTSSERPEAHDAPADRGAAAGKAPAAGEPQEAYAAALAALPGMGPTRLAALLRQAPPEETWRRVLRGEVGQVARRPGLPGLGAGPCWADVAAQSDVGHRWAAIMAAGIHTAYLGGPGFPDAFANEPEPPGVLFWLGHLEVLDRPCVAIIGTRQCTSYGRGVAMELGRDLAECGVCVVSGLALGIDGAAHLGALAGTGAGGAGPLGVAASGVDVPYPRRHSDLWRRVAAAGAVISETAPGQPAQAWRFPARNRLIAGLSRAVVVVESHASGGSMLTVAAAAERGIDVLAVPGPVTSTSSAGTNQLLYEGLAPVRHAGDVLAAIGDLRPWPPTPPPPPPPKRVRPTPVASGKPGAPRTSRSRTWDAPGPGARADLEPSERRVLESIDRIPTATSVIADRTGMPIGPLSVVLLHLEGRGLVRGEGAWWERYEGQ